jgi:hypothetical protein
VSGEVLEQMKQRHALSTNMDPVSNCALLLLLLLPLLF